ncbi:SMI1/KNR4 family protein, partial [Salmonella enterica subsp. enterica serovar Kentucky]|nr:SMI1/KNR4 family protein [Salmonella enterica subsp. enterica serovar Kentucky]
KNFSLSFPDDYKDFLSRYNGFVVKQPDFCEFDYDSVDDGAIAARFRILLLRLATVTTIIVAALAAVTSGTVITGVAAFVTIATV